MSSRREGTYTVQMHRMLLTKETSVEGKLDRGVTWKGENHSLRKQVGGSMSTTQDLEQNGNCGRLVGYTVECELASALEIS